MVLISKTIAILMSLFYLAVSSAMGAVLINKYIFVRCGETYSANANFRWLWYLFLISTVNSFVGDLAELIYYFTNSKFFQGIRYIFRNSFGYTFTSVLLLIVILIHQVIKGIKREHHHYHKYLYALFAIPGFLLIPVIIYGVDLFLPIGEERAKVVEYILSGTAISNSLLYLVLGLWMIYLFLKLISIIKGNILLKNKNEAMIRRWKLFLLLMIICGILYFIAIFMSCLEIFEFQVYGDLYLEEVPEGKLELYNELIVYNILRLLTSVIIVFFSPYSYIIISD